MNLIITNFIKILLVQAEEVFKVTLSELSRMKVKIADDIGERIEERYVQRRNSRLISLIYFLKNPIGYKPSQSGTFVLREVGEIREDAKEIYKR